MYAKYWPAVLIPSLDSLERQRMRLLTCIRFPFVTFAICFCVVAQFGFAQTVFPPPQLVDYIRPFVGTQGEGNTYPGAVAPFGMLQLSPDTEDSLWETASGYEYSDSSIIGFSLAHLSGPGIPDLGDFPFIPEVGTPKFIPGPKAHPDSGYRSPYLHQDESASAGYYQVKLKKISVNVELTAADRSGMLRFTFPQTDSAYIVTDLHHVLRWEAMWSDIRVLNDSTVTGYHVPSGQKRMLSIPVTWRSNQS